MNIVRWLAAGCITAAMAVTAVAGEADVIRADAVRTGPGVFRFSVSVIHQDEGWDHYADRWEVLDPNGRILATRTLHHPHVDEQPFTRSLGDVKVPAGIRQVSIRAHCSLHAYGGKIESVSLSE